MRYKTGEFAGTGEIEAAIEHGLGEIPFLFAFIGDSGDGTSGTLAGVMMNTGFVTNYTTAVQKKWLDSGCRANGENAAFVLSPNSAVYGVTSVNENRIVINQYASNQKFISGKTYRWIAIADWR